jgi:DNA-binding CsgD family transcriptional regulator
MLFALILDQRRSRKTSSDLVESWLDALNRDEELSFELPFERTAGDEMQALAANPETAVEAVLRAAASRSWWVGLGAGPVDAPLPDSVRAATGEAFFRARQALDSAKRGRSPLAVRARETEEAQDVEAALLLVVVIRSRRSPASAEAADLRRQGLSVEEIATRLDVTPQAVYQRIRTGYVKEEEAGHRLAVRLARKLLDTNGPD